MMFKDLVRASRSYRSFDPSCLISNEQLTDFVDCARFAPSSVNLQLLKYRLVTEETERSSLLSSLHFAGKLKDVHLPPKGHEPTAYIVVCADTSVISSAANFQKDVGIVSQTILLAATEAGFGGCIVGNFDSSEVSKCLFLSENDLPQLVLALGKPDETVELTDAKPDGSVTYYRENGIHYVEKRALSDLIIK